ncbi:adenylate/guanylate cyclase domain-containing protein [Marinobacterium nitratireducens]|uniref:Adenylate/guanylate cyclase domain-containing protein n=2 Tax=Marinobacterium nitratireducens TaxID=518897 RepID=A0A917ZL24_9GAMM|nr:adenylate/guanylate cyclase domain-containing protein [Marinobacterium nitratireducens]
MPAPVTYPPPHLAARLRAEQAALAARSGTEGERKTITVLFADMAGSTAMVHDRDPEDARRLIDPVLALMMEAVHHYQGHVAKSLGDGILALFGAPIGCEEHAQRALYAALRMQEAMRHYGNQVRLEDGVSLQIRVGVHTGEVVVRAIRTEDLHVDYDPVGHTINIASRLEGIAAPGSVLVSDETYRLAEGYFRFKTLGATAFKGVPEPLVVHEVLGSSPLRTRLQVAASRGLARFIGRREELAQMRSALHRACAGNGQIVGVVGEPGVGKSRLFYEFKHALEPSSLVLETYSVSHGKAFPYLPLIELLKNYMQILPQDDERQRREKVTGKALTLESGLEDCLPYLLYLLGLCDATSPLPQMDLNIRRRRTFDAIKRLLLRESLKQPLILIFEDLQWLDRETEAFIDFFADALAGARVLLLVNFRPEYPQGLGYRSHYTQLQLEPLGQDETGELLETLLGPDASLAPIKPLIMKQTEGNPFFLEEVFQTLLEEEVLSGAPGHCRLERMPATLHIPTTVQGVLTTRIDRLAKPEKELLQTLAVIGKAFVWSLVSRLSDWPEDELQGLLSRLQAGEFIYEHPAFPEVEYNFKHGLTQEVAYGSLLKGRRSQLHERTGQAIEALYRHRLDDHFGELAHHYSRSGNVAKAIEFQYKAGVQAAQRSANREAAVQLGDALAMLQQLPAGSERDHLELEIQLVLGAAQMSVCGIGSAKVEQAYTRALSLCRELQETQQLFPVLVGLRRYYTMRANFQTAQELAEQLLRLAGREQDEEYRLQAHFAMAAVLLFRGRLDDARRHFEQCTSIGDPEAHRAQVFCYSIEPGMLSHCYLGWILWYRGYADQALAQCENVANQARESSPPFVLAEVFDVLAELHQLRGEAAAAQEWADAAMTLSSDEGLPYWLARGSVLSGWALARQGQHRNGIARIRDGLRHYESSGGLLMYPRYLALLSEALGAAGRVRVALKALATARTQAEASGERMYLAEILRQEAELMLAQGGGPEPEQQAERCLLQAIDTAQEQDARALKLRAATSLARLWRRQGKTVHALRMLRDSYRPFTEGFDTADLREARSLLEQLTHGA